MGVDYYSCDCCNEGVYEEYVSHCSKCGHKLCTNCLVNDDLNDRFAYRYYVKYDGSQEQKEEYGIEDDWEEKGYVKLGEPIDDAGIDSKYCPFCNGKEIHEKDLLKYLIEKYNLDMDQIKQEYLKTK